jgi:hypothetical protein
MCNFIKLGINMKVNKKFRFSPKFFDETETSILFRFFGNFGSKFFSLETLSVLSDSIFASLDDGFCRPFLPNNLKSLPLDSIKNVSALFPVGPFGLSALLLSALFPVGPFVVGPFT